MYACLHAPGNLPLLLKCAGHFSPFIEETSADTVVFDVAGLRMLFGPAQEIAHEIERRVGIPAGIAIASNPDAAVHAARGFQNVTVLPEGQEARVLAPLPLNLLSGSAQFAHTLDTWGVRTFGELAALPEKGVVARLGEEGLRMQRLARGLTSRMLRVRGAELQFHEDVDLEEPVDLLEPLLFLLSGMLRDLCRRLGTHGLASNEIRLRMKLEAKPEQIQLHRDLLAQKRIEQDNAEEEAEPAPAAQHKVTIPLPVPMCDHQVFLKLLQLELNDRPPQGPVEKLRLELQPVQTRVVQHGLFQPAAPEPEKLEITLARIRHLVGAVNVGAPELLDTHRPDTFRMGPLMLAKKTMPGTEPRRNRKPAPQPILHKTLLAESVPNKLDRSDFIGKSLLVLEKPVPSVRFVLRRFRPPRSLQVWCDSEGRPVRVLFAAASGENAVLRAVTECAGPWRTSGGWWESEAHQQPWDHRQWDVEIENQGLFLIHQDARTGRWFADGSYD